MGVVPLVRVANPLLELIGMTRTRTPHGQRNDCQPKKNGSLQHEAPMVGNTPGAMNGEQMPQMLATPAPANSLTLAIIRTEKAHSVQWTWSGTPGSGRRVICTRIQGAEFPTRFQES